jgi:hypothetical protein
VARRRQPVSEQELRILLLSDDEVLTQLDTFVEEWKKLQDAEGAIRKFDSENAQPRAGSHVFEDIKDFLVFNERRREYWRERTELHRQRDEIAYFVERSSEVVRVLLPKDCSLVHVHKGSRYAIRNLNNKLEVTVRGAIQSP